jgi:hypothetical protein
MLSKGQFAAISVAVFGFYLGLSLLNRAFELTPEIHARNLFIAGAFLVFENLCLIIGFAIRFSKK